MTTNLEWLYEHDESFAYGARRFVVDDGYSWCETLDQAHEWLMSPYANDDFAPESVVTPETVDANDANAMQDSREKLEADVRKYITISITSNHDDDGVLVPVITVLEWLNRQAAITRHEVLTQPDERDEQIAELAAQVDELAQQLTNARADCEEYRELFSKAITHAHEIVNLQP